MKSESIEDILVLRICHDLITPFNAISLGLDTFEISPDPAIVKDIRESVDKANVILKYTRSIFSNDEKTTVPLLVTKSQLSDFVGRYRITLKIDSAVPEISGVLNKILLLNGILAKEILPMGGETSIEIGDNGTIVMQCRGAHLVEPSFTFDENSINYRGIVRYYLKCYLEQNQYITKVDRINDNVIFLEKKI